MAPIAPWKHWSSLQRDQLLDYRESASEKSATTGIQHLVRAVEDKRREKRWCLLFRSSWSSWESKMNIHEGKQYKTLYLQSRLGASGIQTSGESIQGLREEVGWMYPWDQRSKNHILSFTRIQHHRPFLAFFLPDFMSLYQGKCSVWASVCKQHLGR